MKAWKCVVNVENLLYNPEITPTCMATLRNAPGLIPFMARQEEGVKA
jgi:hypothetical protein